jgi:REP element-mobilizing transposase RayT
MTSGEAFVATDRMLDTARTGPMYLRMPEIAELTVGAIESRASSEYDLHSYAVMANHVHLLITPYAEVSVITRSLKGTTAREANRALHLTGQPFWQDESYDRLVRDGAGFRRITRYIDLNPVRAGVVATPEEFLWSSAGRAEARRRLKPAPQIHG